MNIYEQPPPEQDEELIGSIGMTLSALWDRNTLALILEQKMICLKNIHRGNTD